MYGQGTGGTWSLLGDCRPWKDVSRKVERDLTIVSRSWSGTIRSDTWAFTVPGMTVASGSSRDKFFLSLPQDVSVVHTLGTRDFNGMNRQRRFPPARGKGRCGSPSNFREKLVQLLFVFGLCADLVICSTYSLAIRYVGLLGGGVRTKPGDFHLLRGVGQRGEQFDPVSAIESARYLVQ